MRKWLFPDRKIDWRVTIILWIGAVIGWAGAYWLGKSGWTRDISEIAGMLTAAVLVCGYDVWREDRANDRKFDAIREEVRKQNDAACEAASSRYLDVESRSSTERIIS